MGINLKDKSDEYVKGYFDCIKELQEYYFTPKPIKRYNLYQYAERVYKKAFDETCERKQ